MKHKKNILKKNIAFIVVTLMVLSTITVINAEKTESKISFNDPVLELRFYQMDYTFDENTYENTDWGSVDLLYVGQEPILYFNLAVNGEWQVQNIPVLSGRGVDVDQIMTYSFDLGNEVGEVVTDITYGYALTETILLSMPTETDNAIVKDGSVIMGSGFGGEMPSIAPAEPLIGDMVFTTHKYAHKNFPNQEAGKKECVPTAVSNSLKFLNDKYNLGMDEEDITIDEMKDATDWDDGCSIDKWWEKKKEYMEDDDDYPITTRKVTDMKQIIKEIEDGQDVEITESAVVNGTRVGHTFCLVGISKLKSGKYSLDISHDKEQGKDGGTITETITYNPKTNKFKRDGFGYTKFENAVVECPKLAKFKTHWNRTSGCSLEIFGTHNCDFIRPAILDVWAKKCRNYSVYLPKKLGDKEVNDIIFVEKWWNEKYDHEVWTKYATKEYDDENAEWDLLTVSNWVDENIEGELITHLIGDLNGELPELYIMVEMDKFLENPTPPQDEYLVINGECEDLPGYLIGTTPIVFNPNAGPDENPFSTTPLEYYVLSNLGEITISPPSNQAPYSPKISGPPNGKPGIKYEFTIVTTDPEDDNVFYNIDWGDGNTESIGPHESGEEVTVTNTWSSQGSYMIKAQAKDVFGAESEWGELEVKMPRDKTIKTPFHWLQNFLQSHPNMFPIIRQILNL